MDKGKETRGSSESSPNEGSKLESRQGGSGSVSQSTKEESWGQSQDATDVRGSGGGGKNPMGKAGDSGGGGEGGVGKGWDGSQRKDSPVRKVVGESRSEESGGDLR